MLYIFNKMKRAKVAKNLGHLFFFWAEKVDDRYKIFFNLVKRTWRSIDMAKKNITILIKRICLYINANKNCDSFAVKL